MRDIRVSIAILVLILICFGVVMIYSSSGVYALDRLGDSTYFLDRHLLYLGIGLVMTLLAMTLDYRNLQKYAKPLIWRQSSYCVLF